MNDFLKKLKGNERGFSLVEIVLSMVIVGILSGVASQVLGTSIDSYSFIKNRQAALSDVRYAVNRMAGELLKVGSADLISVSGSDIQFTDKSGVATSFQSGTVSGKLALMRGGEVLATPIQSFSVVAYDQQGAATTVAASIRRFKVRVSTAPVDKEGSLSVTTSIFPRAFLYQGYQ